MKIIICGAGKVGTSIAKHLVNQKNDVTVIDRSDELINKLREKVDLKTIVGSASNPSVLKEAGGENADMIIAVTLQDEINMVACQMAHTFFKIPRKIARLRTEDFLNPKWRDLYKADNMPIDLIISPELEVARSIEKQLKAPGANEVVPFMNDNIELINISINDQCPLVDTKLSDIIDLFQNDEDTSKNLKASIIAIVRNDNLMIPEKNDKLIDSDEIFILVDTSQVKRILSAFGHNFKPIKKIIVIGGGRIGFNLVRDIEEFHTDINSTVIETNPERAKYIADFLNSTLVLNGDGLDQEILDEANIKDTDMVLALTNDDETNIIISAVAKKNNCESLILVNNSEYDKLKDVLGVDKLINPRMTTVSKILKHIHKGKIESVYSIGDNQAEIIHAKALKSSRLVNKTLREANLPEGIRVGLIKRDNLIIVPNGETTIEMNDEIIFLSLMNDIEAAEELFQVRDEY